MRNLCNNKKVSKLPHLSKFVDDLSQQSCYKLMSDSHIVLKSPDLSCETYLSTPQMIVGLHTVTSQNNLKNLLHLTGSAEMKKVSKFPTPRYLIDAVSAVGTSMYSHAPLQRASL